VCLGPCSYNKTLLKGFPHPLTVTNIQVGLLAERRGVSAAAAAAHWGGLHCSGKGQQQLPVWYERSNRCPSILSTEPYSTPPAAWVKGTLGVWHVLT